MISQRFRTKITICNLTFLLSYLQVAIVVPDTDVLIEYARSMLGLRTEDVQVLCKSRKVKDAILESMAKCANEYNLKPIEQVCIQTSLTHRLRISLRV